MKKFILFLFLAHVFSQQVFAQDFNEDEFAEEPETKVETISKDLEKNKEDFVQDNLNEAQINAFSQKQESTVNQGSVVLEKPNDLTLSYKQRRKNHGILFSVMYEKYYPLDYFSQYRDVFIEDIIGSDSIPLYGAELGYKLNFKLGSISALASYSQGSIVGSVLDVDRTINIKKYGASVNLALDNYYEEPWIVPYGQVGLHQFEVDEDDLTKPEAKTASTQIALNYKFGLLFQLNWIEKAIDPSTQVDGLRASGLENTFLDIFVASHLASSSTYDPTNAASEGDPDLASDPELGAGLKMEF